MADFVKCQFISIVKMGQSRYHYLFSYFILILSYLYKIPLTLIAGYPENQTRLKLIKLKNFGVEKSQMYFVINLKQMCCQ